MELLSVRELDADSKGRGTKLPNWSVGLDDIDILARILSRTASLEGHIRVLSTIRR